MKFILSAWGCDLQSRFNRIWPEVSNNVALANGLDPEQLECHAGYVDVKDREIKTGLDVSKTPIQEQACTAPDPW